MTYFWINGQSKKSTEPCISPYDRGFLIGDGIFETLRIAKKKIFHTHLHLDRLKKSCDLLNIKINIPFHQLEKAMNTLMEKNDIDNGSMRLTVSRGPSPRGLTVPDQQNPTILITTFHHHNISSELPQICLATAPEKRDQTSPLYQIKTTSMLPFIFGRMMAQKKGADDALFLNQNNYICESSSANFIALKEGHLITPPLTDGLLGGIFRHRLIQAGLCYETSIPFSQLKDIDAVWLTTSLGISSVIQVDDIPFKRFQHWDEKLIHILKT